MFNFVMLLAFKDHLIQKALVKGKYVFFYLNRLSENAKFKKSGIDIKGLMTQEFAKIPILGQPVK